MGKRHGALRDIHRTPLLPGHLVSDVLVNLKEALRRNLSHDRVRMASIYFNPEDRSTWTARPVIDRPHYNLREVDHKIIYPQSVYRLKDPRREMSSLSPRLHGVLYS